MQTGLINYWSILACGVASMVLGFLWYGPVFGKMWMQLMGKGEMSREAGSAFGGKKGATKGYLVSFIGALVMAYVFSHTLVFASAYLKTEGIAAGLSNGFWLWLGFIAPVTLGSVLWDGKPMKLWVLNNGFNLIQLLIFGIILGTWM